MVVLVALSSALSGALACGSSSGGVTPGDGGGSDASRDGAKDAGREGSSRHDSGGPSKDGGDGGTEASITGVAIVSATGAPLKGAPGDAIELDVVYTRSDGTTSPVETSFTWTEPSTVTAQNPADAGSTGILPEAGTAPTAFFVDNPYRITHDGLLYIVAAGASPPTPMTVSASIPGHGTAKTTVTVLAAPTGDALNGKTIFQTLGLKPCASCHGTTGAGSPPVDGGEYKLPLMGGELFAYPAPGLNDAPDSGNLADDPSWTAGLLGMAAQADIDNEGVALRTPMPTFFDVTDLAGKPMNAQDFADIYAFLKTQTH